MGEITQSHTPKKSRKPQTVKEKAALLHIKGKSNRAIARELSVDPHTVANMLQDDSEALATFRRQLRSRVPRMLRSFDQLLASQDENIRCRSTLWGLENTRVGFKKFEEEIHAERDEFAGRTAEELHYFIAHGCWEAGTEGTETPSAGKTSPESSV